MQRLKKAIRTSPVLGSFYRSAHKFRAALRRVKEKGAYMIWSYVVLEEKKVIYLVMQKAACTSIMASMTQTESTASYLDVNQTVRNTGLVLDDFDPTAYQGYYVFTFVRNPFERLISCYENKYHTDKDLRAARKSEMKYDSYLMGYLKKDRGFRSFASRVCRIPDRLADQHFVSQSFLIDRMGKNPKPDFVGHYENLSAEYEPIRAKYGFMPLPHHNKTPKASSWMDYYDLSTARKVYHRYRTDIERYGYRETYDKLIAHLQSKGVQA